jgi:hypothetical protein
MQKSTYFFILIFITLNVSCTRNSNPLSEQNNIEHGSKCLIDGLEIEFADTCSYRFICTFMSEFDSIKIKETYLGCTFYLYTDSADDIYWENYFQNDSTIQRLVVINSADSLILKIKVTGEKTTEEEQHRFSLIKNLEIIKIKEHPKLVYVEVPENTESEWASLLEKYSFINKVSIIGICYYY